MKILFICRSNVGRSQVAEEFYRKLNLGETASAGTIVDIPGQVLRDRDGSGNMISAMSEVGIDISGNLRTQVTPEMLDEYEKIVVMAEPEIVPDYLKENSKVETWEIEDTKVMSLNKAREIRDEIKRRVNELGGRIRQNRF